MKEWTLERFKKSTFKRCTHQPLPFIEARPIKIHVDPNTTPIANHTPIYVPLHWKEQVKANLDKDVRLGSIEPVPMGRPVKWLHRMVITAKEDGSPRRTVDLSS